MTAASSPNSSEPNLLDPVIAMYLEAVERGDKPDRDRLMLDHPQLASELRAFFADLDRVHQAAGKPADYETTVIGMKEPSPGTILGGRYKLLENIGEGGMGSVWVAEQQQPVKRKVAVKMIKAGMDSKQVLARFEAERQALAVMDHPNIAKVFDGGMMDQGRPYFVMEYVKGIPFTEYCDRVKLSLKERLILFIPVCHAVQHAHHKGIVHRDLKPSNILICLYDGKPVPKVIDFGLAKAMHQPLTEKSIHTGHGIMVGTPVYMSPEQAEHNNLDVDTRTDIYSLGVVLYELLVGTTPLEREQLRTAAYNEILRLIKEVEPQRPSVRLSGSATLPSVAAQRNVTPRHLQKLLVGDLDWIVMKSLEKERTRRYDSATSLARDLERFLNEEAVDARPPSVWYRFEKFRKKHRSKLTIAAILFLSQFFGVVIAAYGWRQSFLSTQQTENKLKQAENKLNQVRRENDSAKAKQAELDEKLAGIESATNRTFIEEILRPIGQFDEPTSAELRAIVDWSATLDSQQKMAILETAFEDPACALRVARRAERTMQACVTLSRSRRDKALEFLSTKQRDQRADPRIRIAAVWLSMELDSEDLIGLSEAVTWLRNQAGAVEFGGFFDLISRRHHRFSNDQIATCCASLVTVLEKQSHDAPIEAAANSLIAIAPKLTSDQIDGALKQLLTGLKKPGSKLQTKVVESVMHVLLPKLAGKQIDQYSDLLITIVRDPTAVAAKQAAGSGLIALVPNMSGDQIKKCGDAMIEIIGKANNAVSSKIAGKILKVLTPKLSDEQVSQYARVLIEIHRTASDVDLLRVSANSLLAVAPRVSDELAQQYGEVLIALFERLKLSDAIQAAEIGLVAFAPRFSDDQNRRFGNALISVIGESSASENWWILESAGVGLISIADRLPNDQVQTAWNELMRVVEKVPEDEFEMGADSDWVANSLDALSAQLEGDQITRGWDQLMTVLIESRNFVALEMTEKAIITLASRIPDEKVAQCGETLARVFEETEEPSARRAARNGISALASRMTSEQCEVTGDILIKVLENTKNEDDIQAAGNCFVVLAPKLRVNAREQFANALVAVLDKNIDERAAQSAVNALIDLAPKLPGEKTQIGANALIEMLNRTSDQDLQVYATEKLAELAPQLTGEQIARSSDILIAILQTNTRGDVQRAIGSCLSGLAPRLSHDQATLAADALAASLDTQSLFQFMEYLDSTTMERLSAKTLTLLLDELSSDTTHFLTGGWGDVEVLEPIRPVAMSIPSDQLLAVLLQHPACVGKPREWMLQRFEELVFHDGKHVLLRLSKENDESQFETTAQPIPDQPPRRFHTIHDAAAWIQKSWTTFNLEATCPVTWRGEM